MISYGPLIKSAVAGQQLQHGLVITGNALDTAYRGGLEATPTVL